MDNSIIMSHSQEVEDILSKTPNWITRWGITIIILVIAFIILISNFIIFPDYLSTKATISSTDGANFNVNIVIPQAAIMTIDSQATYILRFESYPFQEYGIYKSKIQCISRNVIKNECFIITAQIPKRIKTSMNKEIILVDMQKADCDMIISKISLFKKISEYIYK
jgi:hypothetical protein